MIPTAHALREVGARNIVLKLGDRGAVIFEADRDPVVLPAVEVEVVDTTAAGDAFNGAFAVALAQGQEATEAARFASVAAAIAVSRPGAQSLMATREEIAQLHEYWSWRCSSGSFDLSYQPAEG